MDADAATFSSPEFPVIAHLLTTQGLQVLLCTLQPENTTVVLADRSARIAHAHSHPIPLSYMSLLRSVRQTVSGGLGGRGRVLVELTLIIKTLHWTTHQGSCHLKGFAPTARHREDLRIITHGVKRHPHFGLRGRTRSPHKITLPTGLIRGVETVDPRDNPTHTQSPFSGLRHWAPGHWLPMLFRAVTVGYK